jgi:broad specificity phosphatase PhoE
MSELLLVRHGQASMFSDDYDVLSATGVEQAKRLAQHWLGEGFAPDAVWSGTLRRQQQSAAAAGAVFAEAGMPWPVPQCDAGFNEYPADELMPLLLADLGERYPELMSMSAAFEAAHSSAERYRRFHQLLEAVMSHWVAGHCLSPLPLTWQDFSRRVRDALRRSMDAGGSGQSVVVFTSGGPVGVSVQSALAAPDIKAMELNWRIHNASVTRYTFSGKRVSLDAFNDTRHLPPSLRTYR